MRPSDFVIVIGRQCGSGGRDLGRALALRLGVDYYDRRLLKDTSEALGLRPEVLERSDERRPSWLSSWLSASCGAENASYHGRTFSEGDVRCLQGGVIRGLMERGGCVIVGRGADYIGRDLPNVLSVFLHAPEEARLSRMRRNESATLTDDELRDLMMHTDRRREAYYNDFTGRHWGRADNYHLCMDSSVMDEGMMVDMIVSVLEGRCRKLD